MQRVYTKGLPSLFGGDALWKRVALGRSQRHDDGFAMVARRLYWTNSGRLTGSIIYPLRVSC